MSRRKRSTLLVNDHRPVAADLSCDPALTIRRPLALLLVLKRGLEVLTGPVLHLQRMPRAQADDVEERLAEALRAEGLLVQGGH